MWIHGEFHISAPPYQLSRTLGTLSIALRCPIPPVHPLVPYHSPLPLLPASRHFSACDSASLYHLKLNPNFRGKLKNSTSAGKNPQRLDFNNTPPTAIRTLSIALLYKRGSIRCILLNYHGENNGYLASANTNYLSGKDSLTVFRDKKSKHEPRLCRKKLCLSLHRDIIRFV